jgi:hypothetical protein
LASRNGKITRNGQGSEALLKALIAANGEAVRTRLCDVTEAVDVQALALDTSNIGGVFHMTEVLKDSLLCSMASSAVVDVLRPKALGAWHMHSVTGQLALSAAFWFGSYAGSFGNVGSSNHATGCVYLESLDPARRMCGLTSQSMALIGVRGAGSAEATFGFGEKESVGVSSVSMDELLTGVAIMLSSPRVNTSKLLTWPIKALPAGLSESVVSAPPIALWRHRTLKQRANATAAAMRALDHIVPSLQHPPATTDVTVVGAGLTGVGVGGAFTSANVQCAVLDKTTAVGGLWRWFGNPFSRVNSTEPCIGQCASSHML